MNKTFEIACERERDLDTAAQSDAEEQELPDRLGGNCPEYADCIRDSSAALDVKGASGWVATQSLPICSCNLGTRPANNLAAVSIAFQSFVAARDLNRRRHLRPPILPRGRDRD